MNPSTAYVGQIYKCDSKGNHHLKQEHTLLYKVKENMYYSPRYRLLLSDKPNNNGELYVQNAKLLEFNSLQELESASRLKIYMIYRRFLRDLVNPQNFFLVDVNELTLSLEVKKYKDVLATKLDNFRYDCQGHGIIDTTDYAVTSKGVYNIRPFTFDNINNKVNVTNEEIQRTYRKFNVKKMEDI